MSKPWRLDTKQQTLVLSTNNKKLPQIVYWGASLPANENLETLAHAARLDVTGGMLDDNPDLSICPEESQTFQGQPGMKLSTENGEPLTPQFRFKTEVAEPRNLKLIYVDDALGLTYEASFITHVETNIIEMKAQVASNAPIRLSYLSAPVLPAPQQSDELIDFSGRWCGEFQTNHVPWSAGIRQRQNHTGRTGHEHFPAILIPCKGATNTQGAVYGAHYGWSGGHYMTAEELPDGRRQVQFGHTTNTHLAAATQFNTASLYVTYAQKGLNGCASAFQNHVRHKIISLPNRQRPRPVHYNCWEAVYFNHTVSELKEIATRASALGAERFVLDDGWFGQRDDDTTSLGDWFIDTRKYLDGLLPLIEHVHQAGMTFGIWFEPEMVNPESDLYQAQPDWILGAKDQLLGRQQMVLNMTLPEVRQYLFKCISDILSNYEIDYIKWDHNRVLPVQDAAQTNGLYDLLDQLNEAFPNVEIESCASGGGRIDFGILNRTPRVWLSDSNDALERLRIQHNAALFLPAMVTGSHVGPRECHTSGRIFSIEFRAWVAAQRHMGFEMDPRELTEHEANVLKSVTSWWKTNRNWMMQADILRLDSSDESVIAEQHISADDDQFVVFAGKADTSSQIAPRPLCLTGLDKDALYEIKLVNQDDAKRQHLSRSAPLLKTDNLTASGAYLMSQGIILPWSFPAVMWVIEGRKINNAPNHREHA